MESRFDSHDQDILCALSDVILNISPSINSLKIVSSFYAMDREVLKNEKMRFNNFLYENPSDSDMRNAVMVGKVMHQDELHEV